MLQVIFTLTRCLATVYYIILLVMLTQRINAYISSHKANLRDS